MKTLTIEIKDDKVLKLLRNLENMQVLRILENRPQKVNQKLSEKFARSISKKTAVKLQKHLNEIRNEWERDIY
ncbi:MAG TPA: hypothetical protein ENN90_06250 [Mariniphaga anaerophila]|uniref:Uncharacterized protein n=1 Tax=Mariniphaga anaerophila TaxID=1484053 RepID=A0A831LKH0_9BACT|nr:hypothetical protein [Mariniphaga anaerophila]